jgi:gamma-glutamylcyclotransferase (GGCT)/AIG2-like uncharacterized protein YtfP
MKKIFVYGTLVNRERLQAVLGRENVPEYTAARLMDYVKEGLNIIPREEEYVDGYIIEVSESDEKKLDFYEGVAQELYHKIDVTPEIEIYSGDEAIIEPVDAVAYQLKI